MTEPHEKQSVFGILQQIVFVFCCLALLCSIAFTLMYALLGWDEPNPVAYAIIAITWIVSVLVLFWLFQVRNHRRQEMVRRFYLSDAWVYNHEIGYVPLSQIVDDSPYDFVTFAGNTLAKMDYHFDIAEKPENFVPKLLVSSDTFMFHFIEDPDNPDDRGIVIDDWTGSVQKVEKTPDGKLSYSFVGTYTNATVLAMMLDVLGAFNACYGTSRNEEPSK